MKAVSDRDWPEDFFHENGCYECRCAICGVEFDGNKERVVCRVCAHLDPRPASLWVRLLRAVFGFGL